MQHWNWMTLYWFGVWFALGFGVPEGIALATGHAENTLSDQIWHLEGLNTAADATFWNPLTWTIPHFVITCLVLWCALHFVLHIWHAMGF